MNCREFEDIVGDLVRAKVIAAASRAAGMAHAESCERCAARLADECALSAALKSLAASDEGRAAPESVEAALLAAFRAQASNPLAPRSPIRPEIWPRWALIAAAAILIAFGFIVYRAIQNEPGKDGGAVTEKTSAPQPSVKLEERAVNDAAPDPPRGPSAPRLRRGNRPRIARPFILDSVTTYARESEIMTDFFTLGYGDDRKPMERGEVIRVRMPRSALIAFGAPVNVGRADATIEADLLVGEDGMARAIRFVR